MRGIGVARRLMRVGKRTIIWAPESGVGFGNVLYAWLHVHQQQASGADCRLLPPPHMDPWRELFPTLWTDLSIRREDVRATDRRDWVWNSRFGRDFTRAELHGFVRAHLAPALVDRAADGGTVTINVRRGDYYSQPHFRGTYSFDIAAYVEAALAEAQKQGAFDRVVVVSDGIEWCRLKLDALLREHAEAITYVEGESPQDNFVRVAAARRLIGTNSSFSYWGGYVSNVLHGADSQVIMPRFHARLGESPDAYQLDPAWTIVEDIPGGWDA